MPALRSHSRCILLSSPLPFRFVRLPPTDPYPYIGPTHFWKAYILNEPTVLVDLRFFDIY